MTESKQHCETEQELRAEIQRLRDLLEPIEDDPFYQTERGERCIEEWVLAHLLRDDNCYIGNIDRKDGTTTVYLELICNDIFAWGCADSEPFTMSDLPVIYRQWKANSTWGVAKWCCLKRNQKPQKPVEKRMRDAGIWDESMDQLPDNTQDAEVHAFVASVAKCGVSK